MTAAAADEAYERATRLLGERTGLAFPPARLGDVEAGIRRAMARARVPEAARYLTLVERGALPLDDLVAELTVGESYFFREPAQLECIRREILPEVGRLRGPGHGLRVWSAGCAAGEEPYSLAILLEEEGIAGAHLLGTDISRPALARARAAAYGAWSLRGADERLVRRYFSRRADGGLVLDDRIRRRVAFEYLNLAAGDYPLASTGTCGMDLILCRNVLIYLDRRTVRRVARGLFESLADGGWLVTGPSDPLLSGEAPYETVVTSAAVVYRRPAPARAAPDRACTVLWTPPPPLGPDRSAPEPRAAGEPDDAAPSGAARPAK